MQTWKRICEASRKEFSAIYERLDVRLLWRGESYYNPQLRPLVEDLLDRGIAEKSEGASVSSSALASPLPLFAIALLWQTLPADCTLWLRSA